MATNIHYTAIAVLMVTLAATTAILPFLTSIAYADESDKNLKQFHDSKKPGYGAVNMVMNVATTSGCNYAETADSTKGGVDLRFTVPSTLGSIESRGVTSDGVNIHTAFRVNNAQNTYYEIGLIYGDWVTAPGLTYDHSHFKFYWGVGGQVSGIANLPVVAGHDVELSMIYLNSAGQWQAWFYDRTTGTLVTYVAATNNYSINSDYINSVESSTAVINQNVQTLGLVHVISLNQATKVPGDGVNVSTFTHGYLDKSCSGISNSSYGITYSGTPGDYQIGYNGSTKSPSGHQFW